MILPTIHLNGTSPEQLREDYEKAYTALWAAIHALSNAAPNARDYYVQGADAFTKAVAEHNSRIDLVFKAQDEIETVVGHLDAEILRRKERRAPVKKKSLIDKVREALEPHGYEIRS